MRPIIAIFLLTIVASAASAGDACQNLIPEKLSAQLLQRFAGYRLPRESDNTVEDVKNARDNAQSPCLGVAAANLDGHGRADFAIVLTANKGDGAMVVAALKRGAIWSIYKLDTMTEGRSRLYVSSEPAGTYTDVGDSETPLEKGQVETLICPNEVAVFGTIEASGVAYCFLHSRWRHTWISD